jgi:hypothetical protein
MKKSKDTVIFAMALAAISMWNLISVLALPLAQPVLDTTL